MQLLDADIFAAARTVDRLHSGAGRFFRLIVIVFGTISLAILATLPLVDWPTAVVGLAFIGSAPAIALLMIERYAHGVLAENNSYTAEAAVILSHQTASRGADHLAYQAFLRKLTDHPRARYLLLKLLLDPSTLTSPPTADSGTKIVTAARAFAGDPERGRRVDVGDLLLAAIAENPAALSQLDSQHLSKDDLAALVNWERERESTNRPGDPLDPKNLTLTGGFAKDWAAGYTLLLDRYSTDVTNLFSNKRTRLHIVGHQKVIDEMGRLLAKSGKTNVLLVGDPGVGKKTAVLGFAQGVYLGKTLSELSWKHVKMVDLPQLIAGADPQTIESRLLTVLNEAARAGNVILFIDDIETILGGMASGSQIENSRTSGVADASAVVAKFLESDRIQIIATTTYDAYHKLIERNPSLRGSFEKVEVGEPGIAETELITLDGAVKVENEYRILVSFAAVKEVVKLAERYLHDSPFPEKALDLLEEVGVYVGRQTSEKIVRPSHVQEIITRKTDIPVAEATGQERDVLLNLEAKLHARIVNQKEAVAAVSDALRRARAGLKERGKPIGTFLFLGPTGVGKTETAKAVAEAYFGSEEHMIRLDMNEFVQAESVERLQELLTTKAKENPFTLVLFDEIEKANPKIMNLLLRLLDEGKMADLSGKIVDLTNTIIVGTSNAGAEKIREAIAGKTSFEEGYAELKTSLLDYLQRQGTFNPEFLNRFDAVVLFAPLSPSQIGQVVEMMINRLNRQLKEQGIQVKLDPAAVEKLATTGYDPVFGARALRRTLQEKVENVIAKRILSGQVQQGAEVTLRSTDI